MYSMPRSSRVLIRAWAPSSCCVLIKRKLGRQNATFTYQGNPKIPGLPGKAPFPNSSTKENSRFHAEFDNFQQPPGEKFLYRTNRTLQITGPL